MCKSSPVLCAQLLSTTSSASPSNNNAHDNSKDVLTLVASLLTGGTYSLPAPLPLSSLVNDVDAGMMVKMTMMGLLGLVNAQRDKIRNATVNYEKFR